MVSLEWINLTTSVTERDAYLTRSIIKTVGYLEQERIIKESQKDDSDEWEDIEQTTEHEDCSTSEAVTPSAAQDGSIVSEEATSSTEQEVTTSDDATSLEPIVLDPMALVCVVGAGHVPGIVNYFNNPKSIITTLFPKNKQKESSLWFVWLLLIVLIATLVYWLVL